MAKKQSNSVNQSTPSKSKTGTGTASVMNTSQHAAGKYEVAEELAFTELISK